MSKKKKRTILFSISSGVIILIVGVFLAFGKIEKKVWLETEGLNWNSQAVIEVKVKGIEGEYQGGNLSIKFDKRQIEVIEVIEGDISVGSEEIKYPIWSADEVSANETGSLNLMYLDQTAEQFPYINPEGTIIKVLISVKPGVSKSEEIIMDINNIKFASVSNESFVPDRMNVKGLKEKVK